MKEEDGFDFELEQVPEDVREIRAIGNNQHLFTPGFDVWLTQNWHVWREFVRQADAIYRRGFKHYSARTILHWMRHHTAISESGSDWKLNNNISPDLARLYVVMRPDREHFFEFRVMPTSKRAA